MARPAKTVNADGTPAVKREVGPKTLYLIFAPGTDPDFVNTVKSSMAAVTMNSRALIKNLQGGNPAPFLSFTVEAEKRGS